MSRNSVGTYSLPTGTTPVIAGTTVSASNENSVRVDLAAELTNSLDRQGRGAMLAPLALTDGSSSLPGLTFGSETNTGLYRAGTGDVRLQIASTQVAKFQTAGTTLGVTTTAALTSDAQTVNGNIKLAGSSPASGTGFSNTLTPVNVCKAWAKITTDGASLVTLADGFNIGSVGLNSTDISLSFTTPMRDGNYAVVGVASKAGPKIFYPLSASSTAFACRVYDLTGAIVNPQTNACTITLHVYGRQ